MQKTIFTIFALLVMLLAASAPAHAQTTPPDLIVSLRDVDGAPVPQVLVSLRDSTGQAEIDRALTDAQGIAAFANLAPGTFRVAVQGALPDGTRLFQTGNDATGSMVWLDTLPATVDLRSEVNGMVIPDPATAVAPEPGIPITPTDAVVPEPATAIAPEPDRPIVPTDVVVPEPATAVAPEPDRPITPTGSDAGAQPSVSISVPSPVPEHHITTTPPTAVVAGIAGPDAVHEAEQPATTVPIWPAVGVLALLLAATVAVIAIILRWRHA
jgi:hypothetical protein